MEYVGGYTEWLRQRAKPPLAASAAETPASARSPRAAGGTAPTKLRYKEERELEQLPARIEALEAEQAELAGRVATAEFYKGDPAQQARVVQRLAALTDEISAAYARWDALDARRGA